MRCQERSVNLAKSFTERLQAGNDKSKAELENLDLFDLDNGELFAISWFSLKATTVVALTPRQLNKNSQTILGYTTQLSEPDLNHQICEIIERNNKKIVERKESEKLEIVERKESEKQQLIQGIIFGTCM
ncbi:11728_t:CDS:2 [Funneliformis geosporum]|uniref:11728_t:CDS:1 n=1 Tax=Funneliformis geosporum TaxID=1117311 RepID=A0A9W4WPB8_9GLOM|nr:11728_t:CDS:2 [Funneliformis geosporum]